MTNQRLFKPLMILTVTLWMLGSTSNAIAQQYYDPFYSVNSDHLTQEILVNHMEIDLARL